MLRFTKLRLSGFKSFVDPVEIAIAPGLSGIVGPNGCGKSNLVEALRWVMGESSARQMRGGEMEDVIFGGSTGRPARNLAEVAIGLEGDRGDFPAPFGGPASAETRDDDDDEPARSSEGGAVEIEVRRRIERCKGSNYRVNGREARARDVQLLFADAASGARSGALVTQGQVTQLILGKPSERRLLLDEAAGISGIHPRRHEAELRLRAAEANLERLDDVLATLAAQLDNVRRQARQATRYRTICEQIRKTEAAILRARLAAADAEARHADGALATATAAVADATGRATALATRQAEAAAVLPDLRAAEAEALAAVHTLGAARDALEQDARRIEAERAAARRRLDQLQSDLGRARALRDDAAGNLDRLASERQRLLAAGEGEDAARTAAEAKLAEAVAAVAELDARLIELGERISADEAGRAALERTLAELDDGLRRLDARAADGERQRKALAEQAAALPDPDAAEAAAVAADEALARARGAGEAAEARRGALAAGEAEARDDLHQAESRLAPARAEIAALTRMIAAAGARGGPRLIDALDAAPGWEAALAAALGEDLSASTDLDQPAHWRALPPLDAMAPLPEGVACLAEHIGGPDAAARRLAQVGIVADAAEADRLQPDLRPGQRLVGRDGGMWRWDGLTVRAGAPSPAAVMLEQRNRLAALREQQPALEAARDAAAVRAGEAGAAAAGGREAERAVRERLRSAEAAQRRAAEVCADLRQRLGQINARVAAVAEAAAAAAGEREDLVRRREEAAEARAALPDARADRSEQSRLREELKRVRERERDRRAGLDAVTREAQGRRRRLDAIARDVEAWTARRDAASAQISDLGAREQGELADVARLQAAPDEIEGRRRTLLDELEAAAKLRHEAGDRVVLAEAALAEADRSLRAAEKALTEAREERVRSEAALAQAERARRDTVALIAERLGVPIATLAELAEAEVGGGAGDEADDGARREAAERRLERLKRERETMGPVNLRADEEAAEVAAKIAALTEQRQDLTEAIAKLRRGIADLDREGRERLLASFGEVNRHFGELFTHLFGGGRAHLSLSDSDDPLEAGLEIMACPPGKKLQVLSLLSGGEQALTALALRFAVFLTNPAPICVLDEVDAPLDDANVDRFCGLLARMAKSGTRFLVITHHRMTMARMDRLYGVTMVERGVSQLVSVDLQRAEALRETA